VSTDLQPAALSSDQATALVEGIRSSFESAWEHDEAMATFLDQA
jgi:hypothetical protein